MTDVDRILDAAHETSCKAACLGLDLHTLTRAVVVSVLRELAKSYEDPYKVRQEDLIGDELTEMADEIEERTIDRR